MSHPLKHPKRHHVPTPAWPTYKGTSLLVGTSPGGRTTVFYDPTLGHPGLQNAQDLVAAADHVVTANDTLFGVPGGAVNVIIFALNGATDGTGGADHASCDFVTGNNIEVCASFGNSARVSGLFEAELSECSMGGNLCGVSTGEALSRWCAAVVSHNALADFATGPTWAQQGMPDFVTQTFTGTPTVPGDQDPVSTGCAMVFLSWLQGPANTTGLMQFSLSRIAQAMVALGTGGTLAQLYGNLTADLPANAFPKFIAAVNNLPTGVTGDDPFGGFTPA